MSASQAKDSLSIWLTIAKEKIIEGMKTPLTDNNLFDMSILIPAEVLNANITLLMSLVPPSSLSSVSLMWNSFLKSCEDARSTLLTDLVAIDGISANYPNGCPIAASLVTFLKSCPATWCQPSVPTLMSMLDNQPVKRSDMDLITTFEVTLGRDHVSRFYEAISFVKAMNAEDQRSYLAVPGTAVAVEKIPMSLETYKDIYTWTEGAGQIFVHSSGQVNPGFPCRVFMGNGKTWCLALNFDLWRKNEEYFIFHQDLNGVTVKVLQDLFSSCVFMAESDQFILEAAINALYHGQLGQNFSLKDAIWVGHLCLLAGTTSTQLNPSSLSVVLFGTVSGVCYQPDLVWARTAENPDNQSTRSQLQENCFVLGMDHLKYTYNSYITLFSAILFQRFADPDSWCTLLHCDQPTALYTLADFHLKILSGHKALDHLLSTAIRSKRVNKVLEAFVQVSTVGCELKVSSKSKSMMETLIKMYKPVVSTIQFGGPRYLNLVRRASIRQFTMMNDAGYCGIPGDSYAPFRVLTEKMSKKIRYGRPLLHSSQISEPVDSDVFGPTHHADEMLITVNLYDEQLVMPRLPDGRTMSEAFGEWGWINCTKIPVLFSRLEELSQAGQDVSSWQAAYPVLKQVYKNMKPSSVLSCVATFEKKEASVAELVRQVTARAHKRGYTVPDIVSSVSSSSDEDSSDSDSSESTDELPKKIADEFLRKTTEESSKKTTAERPQKTAVDKSIESTKHKQDSERRSRSKERHSVRSERSDRRDDHHSSRQRYHSISRDYSRSDKSCRSPSRSRDYGKSASRYNYHDRSASRYRHHDRYPSRSPSRSRHHDRSVSRSRTHGRSVSRSRHFERSYRSQSKSRHYERPHQSQPHRSRSRQPARLPRARDQYRLNQQYKDAQISRQSVIGQPKVHDHQRSSSAPRSQMTPRQDELNSRRLTSCMKESSKVPVVPVKTGKNPHAVTPRSSGFHQFKDTRLVAIPGSSDDTDAELASQTKRIQFGDTPTTRGAPMQIDDAGPSTLSKPSDSYKIPKIPKLKEKVIEDLLNQDGGRVQKRRRGGIKKRFNIKSRKKRGVDSVKSSETEVEDPAPVPDFGDCPKFLRSCVRSERGSKDSPEEA